MLCDVCVCVIVCALCRYVWRLTRSDELITYFLSYHSTSLTNKDWLPFCSPSMSVCTAALRQWCVSVCCVYALRGRQGGRESKVFLESSRLSLPQIWFWLDPTLSHDALQAEILEILQPVAKNQRKKSSLRVSNCRRCWKTFFQFSLESNYSIFSVVCCHQCLAITSKSKFYEKEVASAVRVN